MRNTLSRIIQPIIVCIKLNTTPVGNHTMQTDTYLNADLGKKPGSKALSKKSPHKTQKKKQGKQKKSKKGKVTLERFTKMVLETSGMSLSELKTPIEPVKMKWMKGHVRTLFGTQQPILNVTTGVTTLTSSGTNLTQVVAMDVSGVAAWSSLANLFDEYRVRRAQLHIQPLYSGYGGTASTLAAMPIIVVVDYDDATAIASLTNAMQYDTKKILFLGSAMPTNLKSKLAQPEGQPDMAWVTTATPVTPFWWKFWSITNLIPSSAAVGYCYITAEIEFRQMA